MDNIDDVIIQATCAVKVNNKVKGTAWLVSEEGYLLTAGHLLGIEKPIDIIEVQFPEDAPLIAHKIYWGYQREMGIDFAVLKLATPPANLKPLPISLACEVKGTFRLCGYGQSLIDISIGKGEFIGVYDCQNSSSNRLFKLDSKQLGQGGYSGGAVVSDDLQSVVAIQISATGSSTGAERDTVLAMPLYRVYKYWESLEMLSKKEYKYIVQDDAPNQLQRVRIDWGEAPDVALFLGRVKELDILEQWIITDQCRLVAILGMKGIGKTRLAIKLGKGGIGKTDLSAKLVEGLQENFDFVVWKKLLNAPPLSEILLDIIKFLSNQQEIEISDNIDHQIARLLFYLKEHRCLLIFDNMEAVLQGGSDYGKYKEEYEDYGKLLRQIGEIAHESCILLTSREKPHEIAQLEGEKNYVRSLELSGLNEKDGRKLFDAISDFYGSDEDWDALIDLYNGNPLALELAAKHIREVFFGDIASFLRDGIPVFKDLRGLLDWHFQRLSTLEKEVMYWLAINREPVTFSELKDDILSPFSKKQLSSTLQSLQRKIPIEKRLARFTLQPVLIEYLTDQLVEQVEQEIKIKRDDIVDYTTERFVDQISEEITEGRLQLFNNHILLKALAKDYVRESQKRLILKPIWNRLVYLMGNHQNIEKQFRQILLNIREKTPLKQGYIAGNILNLLCQSGIDIKGEDFSYLNIQQAYLANINLYDFNFTRSKIQKSVFNQTFGNVFSVAFSPAGNFLATGDGYNEVRLWEIGNYQHIFTYQGHTNWVRSVAFSPDEQRIASCSEDRTIRIWDIYTGSCLNILKGHTDRVKSIDFNSDGKKIASGSEDQTARIWDVPTAHCLRVLQGHTNRIFCIRFNPKDDNIVATCSEDSTIKLWNIHTGECFQTFEANTKFGAISYSPDGKMIASASIDHKIRLWDIRSGSCLDILKAHTHWVKALSFSPDGQNLISCGNDKTIRIWDVSKRTCISTLHHSNWVWSVAVSSDNQTVASASDDQTVKIWDIQDRKCIHTLQGFTHFVQSIAFNPDGQKLASASDDNTIRIWNIQNNSCQSIFRGHTNWVMSVSFSPDGKKLASGSEDNTIRIWDIHKERCLCILQGHTDWVRSVVFSPNGKVLASCSHDSTVKIWDFYNNRCIKTLENHKSRLMSIAFSPNGYEIASAGNDKIINIWNVNNGERIGAFHGHKKAIHSVNFNPNGQLIASGSEDKTIRIWNIRNGKCLHSCQAHHKSVRSVTFSPDGHQLASASSDKTVKIWNVHSMKIIRTLKGHSNKVTSIRYSPDGKLIATGSEDKTIIIWDAQKGEKLSTLRANRPYEGMNITDVEGITDAQKNTLIMLGATDDSYNTL